MKYRKNRGFTLIEIMVSLAILAMIITMFAPLISSAFASIVSSGRSTKAAAVAIGELENAINDPNYPPTPTTPPTILRGNESFKITGVLTQNDATIPSATTVLNYIQSIIPDFTGKDVNAAPYLFGYTNNIVPNTDVDFPYIDVNNDGVYDSGDIIVPVTLQDLDNSDGTTHVVTDTNYLLSTTGYANTKTGTLIIPGNIGTPFIDTNQDIIWNVNGNVVFKDYAHIKTTNSIAITASGNILISKSSFETLKTGGGSISLTAAGTLSSYLGVINIISSTFYTGNASNTTVNLTAKSKISIRGNEQYGSSFITQAKYTQFSVTDITGVISIDSKGDRAAFTTFKVNTGTPSANAQVIQANIASVTFDSTFGRTLSQDTNYATNGLFQ